jgi:DNA-binding NarL/FixJ family response regulator
MRAGGQELNAVALLGRGTIMRHEDLRTPEERFDDLLAEGKELDEIAYRLGWSNWRVRHHYRNVCASLGETPDEV